MNKIKDKLQARAKFTKGKRVGYAKGSPVVDRETGEVLENFKPTPKPTPAPTPAPTVRTAQTPTGRVPTPLEGKLKQVDSSGNILKDTLIGRQPGETAEQYRARTAGQFTPNPNQKTSKDFRENAVKDTRDYASMSDDEIKKLIPQISYGTPGNEKTVPIGQERIDEFRLEKTNPGLLFEMVQKGADISPNDYNDPTAKKVAERLLNQRLAMEKAVQDAASNKPTPKPVPDETPENPFQMQPIPTPAPTLSSPQMNTMDDPRTKDVIETTASQERTARIADTAQTIQQSAQGVVPEAAKIADIQEGTATKPGTKVTEVIDSKETTMADPTTVSATQAAQVAPETVTTGTVTTAQTPAEIEASKMAATTVAQDAQVEAAQGTVSEDSIAKAAGVERIDPIKTATVEIIPGALTERVVGVISEDAKATAVKNVGSSLARITRAKKQLSKAGLSDADIAELANDPDSLEARLADFSEAERGIIEGLPEEALVSNQIDGLLKGIEEGEIPIWARPAVASVEAMLAQRGMSASTVGRDALFNAIIQSAMPIAQSNAQAIQASVAQQKSIEAQEAEANAARGQQTALDNAGKVFQMDMAQFSSDQQIALSNSKFLQTVSLTNASMEQQGIMQDAAIKAQMNLADADFYQKTQIQNAQAFLQMDLTNLSNNQQANVLKAQQNQQRVLSNQAAQNAASQFNAASENQTNQFMTNLSAQINQYNASQTNAMSQFNATQQNAAAARDAQRTSDVNKFNAQLVTQVDQFNSQQDFARNQWNAQNSAAVEASNVQWRRQANTINTAAQNQINMQNSQNAYGLTAQAQSFLWQELRDQADFDFRSFENEENRKAQIISTAMANEGKAGEKYDDYLSGLLGGLTNSFQSGLGGTYGGGSGGGRFYNQG
jgi:hypothetical protein